MKMNYDPPSRNIISEPGHSLVVNVNLCVNCEYNQYICDLAVYFIHAYIAYIKIILSAFPALFILRSLLLLPVTVLHYIAV